MANSPVDISLKNDSQKIILSGPTQSGFTVNLKLPKSQQQFNCNIIEVLIPYGTGITDLTNSDVFETNVESTVPSLGWSYLSKSIDGNHIKVTFHNTYPYIYPDILFSFIFSKLAISANPTGTSERTVDIQVNLMVQTGLLATRSVVETATLKFTLKNEKVPDANTFVGYFASDIYNPSIKQTVTLSWEIYNAKEIAIYPHFIGTKSRRKPRTKVKTTTCKEVTQPYLIDNENCIKIINPVGSLQVQLIKSTQLIIVGDVAQNQGVSQLTLYTNSLEVINFSAPGLVKKAGSNDFIAPYNTNINFDWSVTFSDPKNVNNQLYILASEIDNNGDEIPYLKSSGLEPPTGFTATKVVARHAGDTITPVGTTTAKAFRVTSYRLVLIDGLTGQNLSRTITVDTAAPGHPIGSIVMYRGDLTAAGMTNWKLCNGQEFKKPGSQPELDYYYQMIIAMGKGEQEKDHVLLPNIAGNFVVGVGADAPVTGIAGPPDQHDHGFQVTFPRTHTGVKWSEHNHEFDDWSNSDCQSGGSKTFIDRNGNNVSDQTTTTDGSHKHFVEVNSDPNNKTPNSFEPSTTDAAIGEKEGPYLNRPPYYALNYMIKVSE